MNTIQFAKLLSPDGNPLLYDDANHILLDEHAATQFDIKNGVPILLPKDAKARWMEVTMSNGVRARIFYADHYERDAEAFDYFEGQEEAAARHENRRLHEMIIRQVPKTAKSILDLGCGSAWVAEYFCPKGVEVYSMDISVGNPTRALQKYPFENHAALVADVYALPFQNEVFDCIIAAEVMEHTPDPKLFITSLLRVLKPGGTLIITTPYNENIIHSLCVHCNHLTPHNAHLHSFNENNIYSLLHDLNIQQQLFTFSNKALSRLRTHILFQYVPFKIWKLFDNLANRIWQRPMRLLIRISKEK